MKKLALLHIINSFKNPNYLLNLGNLITKLTYYTGPVSEQEKKAFPVCSIPSERNCT